MASKRHKRTLIGYMHSIRLSFKESTEQGGITTRSISAAKMARQYQDGLVMCAGSAGDAWRGGLVAKPPTRCRTPVALGWIIRDILRPGDLTCTLTTTTSSIPLLAPPSTTYLCCLQFPWPVFHPI